MGLLKDYTQLGIPVERPDKWFGVWGLGPRLSWPIIDVLGFVGLISKVNKKGYILPI